MAIKAALGRADFQVSPARTVTAALASGFIELPVRSEAALKVAILLHHHRDPFDRLLVAQLMTGTRDALHDRRKPHGVRGAGCVRLSLVRNSGFGESRNSALSAEIAGGSAAHQIRHDSLYFGTL
jgi:hypothetical protein